jgi:hypothetical protein
MDWRESVAETLAGNEPNWLESVAFHEAGHVCVAHFLGLEVSFASIEEKGGVPGRARYAASSGRKSLNDFVQVMAALAGPISEARFQGHPWSMIGSRTGDHRTARLHSVAMAERLSIPGDPMRPALPQDLEWLAAKAVMCLVEMNWPAIQAVARDLLTEGRLDKRTIARLCQRAAAGEHEGCTGNRGSGPISRWASRRRWFPGWAAFRALLRPGASGRPWQG